MNDAGAAIDQDGVAGAEPFGGLGNIGHSRQPVLPGNDGAMGTRAIKSAGGKVYAEAEESCVVFGMPKEAIATGLVDRIVPLPSVCKEILHFCGY